MTGDPEPTPQCAPDPDLVFDIGMHRGNDSAFYLALGYRVVGIEADPDLAAFARERFAREIVEGRMTVVEGAIAGTDSETVTFFQRDSLHGLGGMGSIEFRPSIPGFDAVPVTGEVEVPVVDLSDCLERFGTPCYMKVDIEGAERFCLDSLATRANLPGYLSVEADRTGVAGVREQVEALGLLGYDGFQLRPQGEIQGAAFQGETRDGRPLEFVFEDPSSGPFGELLDPGGFVSAEVVIDGLLPSARLTSLKLRLRPLKQVPGFGRLMRGAALTVDRAIPLFEWYDLHARRSEVVTDRT